MRLVPRVCYTVPRRSRSGPDTLTATSGVRAEGFYKVFYEMVPMNLNTAQQMAERLMTEHGIFPEWSFRFDRSKTRHGQARDRIVRGRAVKEITMSKFITEKATEDSVKDTILHEIAHVLVGLEHGHDKVWKKKAQAIGSTAKEYGVGDYDILIELSPYKYYCSVDQEMIYMSHRPMDVGKFECPDHPNASVIRLHNGISDLIVNEV